MPQGQLKSSSEWCDSHASTNACIMQSAFLNQRRNVSSSLSAPKGVLPRIAPLLNFSKRAAGASSDPGLSNQFYAAVVGYQNQGVYSNIASASTTMQLYLWNGNPADLGSDTVSGGLNVHVFDTKYSVDYLFQFYVYYSSAGQASLAWAVYSACAGDGFDCGPAYSCSYYWWLPPYWFCPTQSITLTTGSWPNIGNWGDSIKLLMYWNSNYKYYVFDYQDANQNPYYWTVLDFGPSGTYSSMATGNGMVFGDENIFPFNSPYHYSYYFQVGFSMTGFPSNANWELDAWNTQYGALGQCTCTYVQHAMSLPWDMASGSPTYYSYWKENWVVSLYPAQIGGIYINGFGGSNYNDLWIHWVNAIPQSGNNQVW